MRIEKTHNLPRREAKTRIEDAVVKAIARYGGPDIRSSHEWYGDTMEFSAQTRGVKIKGTIDVYDDKVIIDVTLPLVARFFEDSIRAAIGREVDEALKPDKKV